MNRTFAKTLVRRKSLVDLAAQRIISRLGKARRPLGATDGDMNSARFSPSILKSITDLATAVVSRICGFWLPKAVREARSI